MQRNPSVLLVKALLYTQTHLQSPSAQSWYSCHSGKLPEWYQTVVVTISKICHTVIWNYISCLNNITNALKYTFLCSIFCFQPCSQTDRWQIFCFRCQSEQGPLKQNLSCSVCMPRFRSQKRMRCQCRAVKQVKQVTLSKLTWATFVPVSDQTIKPLQGKKQNFIRSVQPAKSWTCRMRYYEASTNK